MWNQKKSELFFYNSGNKIENRVDSSRKPQIFMCRKASVYAGFGKNKKKNEKTFKKVLTSMVSVIIYISLTQKRVSQKQAGTLERSLIIEQ
ncbi:hypothetical protein [Roseburia sp. AM59-24XD]|uniref:hypothetical protein n=1 Tax=Roseburia sp. AM59-24XD TaxID=2293138 RepID=UPI000E4B0A41|nr:hypothetical protein [Roseburia sp. AM59-24XD]RHP82240.1 hypothetical protein DXA20_13220 [Roseburia sp. AM59-24XD]